MDTCSKKNKKILCFFYLLEGWIDYYHKEKNILYVTLVNAVFVIIISLTLSVLTYMLTAQFINNLFLKYSTFFFVYLFMLSVIVFQNLFDDKFNIITKIRLLILSVISDINIRRSVFNILFYIVSWFILVYFLNSSFYKYVDIKKIKIPNENTIFSYIVLLSFIIIFIVQVYGINDTYIKCRRKLLLYGLSTIISLISAIKSIDNMYKDQIGYTDIFNFQFIVLIFTLIVSIDRFVTNYSTLVGEYSKKYKQVIVCNQCGNCRDKNITIESICLQIRIYLKNVLCKIRNEFFIFKTYLNGKKIKILINIPIGMVLVLIIMCVCFFFIKMLDYAFNYLIANIELAIYGTGNILGKGILNLIKLIFYGLVNWGNIIVIINIIFSLENIKSEIMIFLKEKRIDFKTLKEEFKIIFFLNVVLSFLNIIPIAFISNQHYKKSYNTVSQIAYSYLGVIIVFIIYKIIIKIKNKSYRIEINLKDLEKELGILCTNFYFYLLNIIILFQPLLSQSQKLILIEIYVMAIIISTFFIAYTLICIIEVISKRIKEYKIKDKEE